jgi:ribosomal 50S subunit-recycling heat shock protein
MRIDLTLKYLCLVKSRSVAKALCEKDLVLVDGRPVRPAARAPAGSRVTILLRKRTISIELLEIPRKQLSKSAAVDYYRPVETPRTDAHPRREGGPEPDLDGFFDDFDLDGAAESD